MRCQKLSASPESLYARKRRGCAGGASLPLLWKVLIGWLLLMSLFFGVLMGLRALNEAHVPRTHKVSLHSYPHSRTWKHVRSSV